MLAALAALVLLAQAPAVAESPSAALDADARATELAARRARVLAIAESYVSHRWRAGAANRLHGPDRDGVHVDTPDAGHAKGGWTPGSESIGVPYAWGG